MAKLPALSLLLLSWSAVSICNAQDQYLTADEVRDPNTVVAWLGTRDSASLRKDAQFWVEMAEVYRQRSYWSAAAKAYGEAMIRYPSPHNVSRYADTEIRMLGRVRAREQAFDLQADQDIQRSLDYYRSAMAANAILQTLNAQGIDDLQNKIDCLAEYVVEGNRAAQCDPLRAYFDAGAE